MAFNPVQAKQFIDNIWGSSIEGGDPKNPIKNTVLQQLKEFIAVENESPNFNYNHDLAVQAANTLADWVKAKLPSATVEVKLPDGAKRTPCILVVVEASTNKLNPANVLMYGHFDKQPAYVNPGDEWTAPYHPYKAYLDPNTKKLYGRGGADDGYAIFAAVTSIMALQAQGIPHDKYVIIIEGEEESGTKDVEAYVADFKDIIGTPTLIICADSGAGTYNELWLTTTLRGVVNFSIDVRIFQNEASHSGSTSGIIASTFHMHRELIDRLQLGYSGVISEPTIDVQVITEDIKAHAKTVAGILGDSVYKEFDLVPTGQPVTDDVAQLIINNTYRPSLSILGVQGIPLIDSGNTPNVIRTNTTFLYSVRLPPTLSGVDAEARLKALFTSRPPFGAQITYDNKNIGSGWVSPPRAAWLDEALVGASAAYFDAKPYQTQGEGGSIPLINHLYGLYPNANFVVTGVLGPESNAHTIDESLDTNYAKKISASIAYILYALTQQGPAQTQQKAQKAQIRHAARGYSHR